MSAVEGYPVICPHERPVAPNVKISVKLNDALKRQGRNEPHKLTVACYSGTVQHWQNSDYSKDTLNME